MACLVSISFSLHLSPSQILSKEIHQRKSGLCRLFGKQTTKTALKLLAPSSSNRCILSVNQSYQNQRTPSVLVHEVFTYLDLGSCTHMVIAGYWVGPDIDDGCGFVEALVNQIS